MKQLKFVFAAAAALIAIVTAVNGSYAEARPSDCVWYQLKTNASPDLTDPDNYERAIGDPSCPGSNALCTICLPDNGALPAETDLQDAQNAIEQAEDDGKEVPGYILLKQ